MLSNNLVFLGSFTSDCPLAWVQVDHALLSGAGFFVMIKASVVGSA